MQTPWTNTPTKYTLIIMKSLDPLRAKKTFIRKKLDHTAVSAIKASSVTINRATGARGKYCIFENLGSSYKD